MISLKILSILPRCYTQDHAVRSLQHHSAHPFVNGRGDLSSHCTSDSSCRVFQALNRQADDKFLVVLAGSDFFMYVVRHLILASRKDVSCPKEYVSSLGRFCRRPAWESRFGGFNGIIHMLGRCSRAVGDFCSFETSRHWEGLFRRDILAVDY